MIRETRRDGLPPYPPCALSNKNDQTATTHTHRWCAVHCRRDRSPDLARSLRMAGLPRLDLFGVQLSRPPDPSTFRFRWDMRRPLRSHRVRTTGSRRLPADARTHLDIPLAKYGTGRERRAARARCACVRDQPTGRHIYCESSSSGDGHTHTRKKTTRTSLAWESVLIGRSADVGNRTRAHSDIIGSQRSANVIHARIQNVRAVMAPVAAM